MTYQPICKRTCSEVHEIHVHRDCEGNMTTGVGSQKILALPDGSVTKDLTVVCPACKEKLKVKGIL